MRAYVLVQPGKVELRELPRPQPGADDVVIRVRAALTCGTDIKAFVRGHPKFPMPTLFGHELSGEIAALGKNVRGFHEGDAVMATPTGPCGACFYCGRGQENLCDTIMQTMVLGAYADYVRLPSRVVRTNLFAKPQAMSFPVAALLDPLSCVIHGLELVTVRPDDTVVLIGAGAISLLHLLALRARGNDNVYVIGRSPQRAAFAQRLGCKGVLLGGIEAARQHVLDRTGNRGADIIIECTGQLEVWEAAPSLVRRGGTVIFFGGCSPGTHVPIDTQRFHYDGLRLLSPFHSTPRAVRAARELLVSESFNAAALITGEYRLDALSDALVAHLRGEGIKFAILP